MPAQRTKSSLRKEARDILLSLYKLYYKETGRYLSPDEFFPVDLKKVISSLIHWELESVSDVGTDRYGQMLKGHCDYDNKVIRIASRDTSPGEISFTTAHEIGHALLHSDAFQTQRGSARKKTIRRVEEITTPADEKEMEREANFFAAEILMPEKAVRDYFLRMFGKEKIWSGSSRAQKIVRDSGNRTAGNIGTSDSAEEYSSFFAAYRRDGSSPSLCDFFGVSRSAMSIRLLELKLVY